MFQLIPFIERRDFTSRRRRPTAVVLLYLEPSKKQKHGIAVCNKDVDRCTTCLSINVHFTFPGIYDQYDLISEDSIEGHMTAFLWTRNELWSPYDETVQFYFFYYTRHTVSRRENYFVTSLRSIQQCFPSRHNYRDLCFCYIHSDGHSPLLRYSVT